MCLFREMKVVFVENEKQKNGLCVLVRLCQNL